MEEPKKQRGSVVLKDNKYKISSGIKNDVYTYFPGLKYVVDQERSIWERVWWLIISCILIMICAKLLIETFNKWNSSPIVLVGKPASVWQVPFPAITVCPQTKAKRSVYNYSENYRKVTRQDNMTEEEMKQFADLSLVCDTHLYNEGNLTTGFDSVEFIMEAAPQFDDVLWFCLYTLLNSTCENFFTPILTDEGLCFTSNMVDIYRENVFLPREHINHERKSEGWSLETGYPKDASINTYPRRALSAGFDSGFLLLLRGYQEDYDYICKGPVQGYKILLHNPAEIPRVGKQFIRTPPNQEIVISVKPEITTTSETLRKYDPHRRQCYFEDERKLSFFQIYTQQNCELECLTNFTRDTCGCVAYHMPREESTPICGSGSIKCMFNAQKELRLREMQKELNKESDGSSSCDCLPGCTSLAYNAEISQVDFKFNEVFSAFGTNVSAEFPGIQLTRMNVFFKEQNFIISERNALYSVTDFLASCGGLVALFLGFSFLSVAQRAYLLLLKIIGNITKLLNY